MGVEPTAARSARPADGFEDRGSHRATTTPERFSRDCMWSTGLTYAKLLIAVARADSGEVTNKGVP